MSGEVLLEYRGFGTKEHYLLSYDDFDALGISTVAGRAHSSGWIGFLLGRRNLQSALGLFYDAHGAPALSLGDPETGILIVGARLFDLSSSALDMELKSFICWRRLRVWHRNELILNSSTIVYPVWEALFGDGGFSSMYLDIRCVVFDAWKRISNERR